MRNAIIIFSCLLFAGLASGQAPEKRFVGNCSFSGFTLVADSTYRGNITRFDDRMGNGYNLTQLAVGYEIFDGRGLVFEIDTIHTSTNFTADVSVTAKVNRGFEPFGSGQVYNPTASGMIPPSSQEQAGLSPTQKARIDIHNVVKMEALVGGRDSVYSITNVPDTTSLSPVTGDIFINTAKDTVGFYTPTGWVLFFRGLRSNGLTLDFVGRYDGANGLVNADIEDDGTTVTIGFLSASEVDILPADTTTIGGAVSRLGGQAGNRITVDDDTGETDIVAATGVDITAGVTPQAVRVDDFGVAVKVDGGSYYLAPGSPPVDGKNHVQAWFNGSAQWLNLTDSLAAGGADNLGDHTATTNLNMDGNTILGGTGTTSDLILQTTSGVGTTGADMFFLVGNNGGTEAMKILNNGNIGMGGATTPAQTLHVQGTARITGSDGTPTGIMGRDADGDVGAVSLGTGLTLSGGQLSATGATTSLVADSVTVTPAGNITETNAQSAIVQAARERVPVIMFMGESNSGGQALNADLTAGELAPQPGVLTYNIYTDAFEVLDIGTNNQINHYNGALTDSLNSATQHGWENGLAQEIEKYGLSKIHIVKTGQGGSIVSQWEPTDTFSVLQNQKIAGARALLQAEQKEPVWYVWMSFGINDAIAATDTTTFKNNTLAWMNRVRDSLYQDAPFFLTEIDDMGSGAYVAYDRQLKALAADSSWIYIVETTGLTKDDANHWDAVGMKTIAERMGSYVRDTVGLPYGAGTIVATNPNSANYIPYSTGSAFSDSPLYYNSTEGAVYQGTAATTYANDYMHRWDENNASVRIRNLASNIPVITAVNSTSNSALCLLAGTSAQIYGYDASLPFSIIRYGAGSIAGHTFTSATTTLTAETDGTITLPQTNAYYKFRSLTGKIPALAMYNNVDGLATGILVGSTANVLGYENDHAFRISMYADNNIINNTWASETQVLNFTTSGYINSLRRMGFGVSSPTALAHLGAGTAAASTAPLKFTAGTNLTTPEAGAMEWDGTNLYVTQTTGPTRKTIAYTTDITDTNTNIANTNLTADGNRTLDMNGNQLAVSNAEYISLTGNDGGVSADNAQLIIYGNNTNGIYGVANTSGQDSYMQLKGTDFVVADGALDTTKSIKYLPYANYLRLGNWALQVSDALGSGDDGALMAYNDTNKRWEAALPSGGELYTTAGSSIPAGSYFAAVTGLTSDGLVNFTATDSTLTYTGTKTKDFLIQYDASVTLTTSGSGAFLSQLVIHVDDVEQARTRRQHTVNAAGAETWRYTIAGHQVITLAQNEVVKLKSNNTAGATFTASYLNLTISEKR